MCSSSAVEGYAGTSSEQAATAVCGTVLIWTRDKQHLWELFFFKIALASGRYDRSRLKRRKTSRLFEAVTQPFVRGNS